MLLLDVSYKIFKQRHIFTFSLDPFGFYEANSEISRIGSQLMSQVSSGQLFLTLGDQKVLADGNHTDAAAQLVCPMGLKPAFDQQYCGRLLKFSTRTSSGR